MTIQQLSQAAKDLRDLANRFLLYGEKHSLDDTWRRLLELFRQVPLVLGNRASGFTLEGVPKSWDEVCLANCYFVIHRPCNNVTSARCMLFILKAL